MMMITIIFLFLILLSILGIIYNFHLSKKEYDYQVKRLVLKNKPRLFYNGVEYKS